MNSLDRWIDEELGAPVQSLTQSMRRLNRASRGVQQSLRDGDLASLPGYITQFENNIGQLPDAVSTLGAKSSQYDTKAYLEDGFDADFRNACKAAGLPLEGQFPRYDIFPVVIQVDVRNPGVLISRRRHRGLRVSRIVEAVRAERDRLLNRPFNARLFLEELSEQYDSLVELETAKHGVHFAGQDISLRAIYRRLTPMRQWRSQYPERFFTFDLHRLYRSGEESAPDGRRVRLAPSNVTRNNLRVPDASGRELQLGLISFRKE